MAPQDSATTERPAGQGEFLSGFLTLVEPTYPDWSSSVPVSDLDSLKQQDCCGRESRENGGRMADVSAPPPGVTYPQGMLARRSTTAPRGHIFRIG